MLPTPEIVSALAKADQEQATAKPIALNAKEDKDKLFAADTLLLISQTTFFKIDGIHLRQVFAGKRAASSRFPAG
ncbi:hypothetical protein [Chromobacterium haemolyticum]|uniref:hypothetical protein n=1 Tax=Chromobacterium haemolyticum TaxID=394935 RepID=UPI0012DF4D6A|nr:hypothetical protein [Chromobacterium haemolyticum]